VLTRRQQQLLIAVAHDEVLRHPGSLLNHPTAGRGQFESAGSEAVAFVAMAREPTVLVQEDCAECDGQGSWPATVTTQGRTRTSTSERLCPRCHGDGFIARRVGLSELRRMLDQA
jgi:hypothetical protein